MSAHQTALISNPAFDNQIAPFKLYTLGQIVYGPYSIPEGSTTVLVTIDRTDPTFAALSSSTRAAKVSAEVSFDNGSTWFEAAAFEVNGGAHILRGGATALKSTLLFNVLEPTNLQRLYRVTVILDNNVVTGVLTQWT